LSVATAVALHAAADDGAVEHAECREQGGGAVPFIVIVMDWQRPGLIGSPGWVRSSAWIWALFIDRQHRRMSRRIDIEPDNISELVGKVGIARALD
jgi:hypothetical protein